MPTTLPRTIKLLNCMLCGDVIRLYRSTRYCKCKASSGKHTTQVGVEIKGPARVLGLRQTDYMESPKPEEASMSKTKTYTWYVVPPDSGEASYGEEID